MEGAKSIVARLERMKRGSGIKGRDDKSSGIEIHMSDTLAKINPTDITSKSHTHPSHWETSRL